MKHYKSVEFSPRTNATPPKKCKIPRLKTFWRRFWFPLNMSARDRHWWSHCRSLGSSDTSTGFFARLLNKGRWTYHTHQCFRFRLVDSGNC